MPLAMRASCTCTWTPRRCPAATQGRVYAQAAPSSPLAKIVLVVVVVFLVVASCLRVDATTMTTLITAGRLGVHGAATLIHLGFHVSGPGPVDTLASIEIGVKGRAAQAWVVGGWGEF
jgi:hypothetical protein